jgi:hypothetical protein
MASEVKELLGMMDLDSPNETIPRGAHKSARNIIWRGRVPNKRPESATGFTAIPNNLLPVGTNTTINALYDAVNKRIFFFNYNSAGNHGIYIYSTLTQTFYVLIQTGINTTGDPLGFTINGRITSVDILYGDGNSGDLLFFIDSLKRPTKININRYLAKTYTSISRSFIEVIKAPPSVPAKCTYENDTTVTANNLINSLFQFRYSFIYDDNEESVVSSGSKVPLPTVAFDPTNNVDKSINSRIAMYLQTGDTTVKKIRVYGRQTNSGTTSDWFIIDTLNKSDLTIADNTFYRYLFYNGGNYAFADPKFTVLLQDYVPQSANAQSLLNGTTISYVGITEGYNYSKSQIVATSVITTALTSWALKGSLFFAAYDGTQTLGYNNVKLYLTGVGSNNANGNPAYLTFPPLSYAVQAFNYTANVNGGFTYSNSLDYTSIASILLGLQVAAIAAGWVFVSSGDNYIQMYYPNNAMQLKAAYYGNLSSTFSPSYTPPVLALYPNSRYSYGVVYFDAYGRTNGVITNIAANCISADIQLGGNPPANIIGQATINLSQYSPPSWAVYFHIVRTNTLTYSKYLDWVSNYANNNVNAGTGKQYAYIGITNITDYNTNQNATQGVVSYGFTQGDRIRVTGVYDSSQNFTPLNFDYAVVGVVVNPTINGNIVNGTFIQIAYPTNDISPVFKLDGSQDFQTYSIVLYNYMASSAGNLNVYYEIGERYPVINTGTSLIHSGDGNSSDGYINFTEGDCFFRPRTIPAGQTYYDNTNGFQQATTYSTLDTTFNPPIITPNYELRGGPHVNTQITSGNYSDGSFLFYNKTGSPIPLRLRGTFTTQCKDTNNGTYALYALIIGPGDTTTSQLISPIITGVQVATPTTITFDSTVNVPSQYKVWIVGYAQQIQNISGFPLRIDIVKNITINCFDASFSDIYLLKTSNNSRPNVTDTTALQTYFSTLFRFSKPYQLGTNINNTNRFFPNNFDEWDKSFGSAQRMRVRGKELIIFQERRCGHVSIYSKFISDNTGNKSLITTDAIITQNNIQYYEGEFGIGNQPSSLVSSGYADYFVDPVKGVLIRLSLDGCVEISRLYKVQSFVGPVAPKYLKNYNTAKGYNAIVLGAFNYCNDRESEVMFCFQGGVYGTDTILGQSIAFNEADNAFTSFYDFAPEAIVSAENTLYCFFNGALYAYNNTTNYANFFGVQNYPEITLVFSNPEPIKKTYDSIVYQSNKMWFAPNIGDVNTSQTNEQTLLAQVSKFDTADVVLQEWMKTAALKFDANSRSNQLVGLWEGDYLKGFWIQMRLTYQGSDFTFIHSPYIKYNQSPKNL